MSYILDALKKSEQERGHGTAPSVQTLHSSGISYHSRKSQLWPYFLLAAVIINLAALLYFIMTQSDADTSVAVHTANPQAATAVPDVQPTVALDRRVAQSVPTGPDESIVYKPVSMPGTHRTPAAVSPNTVSYLPPATEQFVPSIVEMSDLPFDVLQHIPALEFSAHVYSTNPQQRSIVINGRFMEEGDHVANDLYLSEITADGAIFDFQGQRFHQRVVSTWN